MSQPNVNAGAGETATSQASVFHTLHLHPAWLLAYIGFVIYGNLVPLDFHPHPLDWAWEQFQRTPMLQLGIDNRADWIANGVLFVPVGFLFAERFVGKLRGAMLGLAMAWVIAFSTFLACGIEFTQLFFPPRTVSQNDIIAEIIGAVIGVALALPLSSGLRRAVAFRPSDGTTGTTLLLRAYMLAYLAYSLFPYDFLLSVNELAKKLASDNWGLLFAANSQDGSFRKLVWLGIETVMAVPFGIFIARRNRQPTSLPVARLITGGVLLGLCIEFAQFFLYNGISQGASVVTRIVGVLGGGLLWKRAGDANHLEIRRMLRRHTIFLAMGYLLGLATILGWFSRPWSGVGKALASLGELRLMPFYYHYYTSEAHALASLLSVVAMYLPIGILAWAWSRLRTLPILAAATLATIVEASKLFIAGTHADPTNVLIAATTAWAVAHLAGRLTSPMLLPTTASNSLGQPPKSGAERLPPSAVSSSASVAAAAIAPAGWVWLALIIALGSFWVAGFPVQPLPLAIVFIASGAAVWFVPISALAIIPFALPVFDLAPWSGRFYLDEFDVLLAITLSIGYLKTRSPGSIDRSASATTLNAGVALLVLSFAISTIGALVPWTSPDINSFSTYLSQFNALRIGKGLFWALLFARLARRIDFALPKALQWFSWGMALGLAATVGIIAREKLMFGGLLNFSTDYRATGPFSAIHTGGAYIECYLAVAAPFLILLIVRTNSWIQRLAGTALLLASTYALMTTVSRNGFSAYAVACSIALLATLAGEGGKIRRIAIPAVLGAAMLAVAVPMFEGDFTKQRMSQVGHDLEIRKAHWRDGLGMRDSDVMTDLFGMGVGRYPATHYWRSREVSHTSAYALGVDGEDTFLRITPGNTVYVEQIVGVEPRHKYRLSLDIRSATIGATVGIALCEKWMLASSRCATWQRTSQISKPSIWQHFDQVIDSAELGSGTWLTQRPIKLSFFTNGNGTIDIDNIRLTRSDGSELVDNGDFSHGMDRWFFATDEHLAWHIKSMPMAILFDQGWFGLLAFGSFFAVAFFRAGRAAWSGDVTFGIVLAAMCGFLVVGIFDTLIDAPRFLFLIMSLALFTTLRSGPEHPLGKAPAKVSPRVTRKSI